MLEFDDHACGCVVQANAHEPEIGSLGGAHSYHGWNGADSRIEFQCKQDNLQLIFMLQINTFRQGWMKT